MQRRSVLAALGAAILPTAGCLEAPVRDGSASPCPGADDLSVVAESDEFVVETDDNTVEMLGFTLENRASCSVTVAPGDWRIERDGTSGDTVARGDDRSSNRTLDAGETHQWSLSLTPHPTPHTEETTYVVADLEAGTYEFVVTCSLAGQTEVTPRAGFTLVKRSSTRQ